MKLRLEEKGTPSDRIAVIPNWVDTREITPQPRDNEWAREHGLVDAFVVMHSGNIGHAQDLDSLVRAATFLRDLERAPHRDRRLRRPPRRVDHARAPARGDGGRPLPPVPAARGAGSVALGSRPALRRARARAGRLRRPEQDVRHPGRRPAGDRRRRRRSPRRFASLARPAAGSSLPPGRPELVAGAIRDAAQACTRSTRWARVGASTSSARPTARSRSTATAASSRSAVGSSVR